MTHQELNKQMMKAFQSSIEVHVPVLAGQKALILGHYDKPRPEFRTMTVKSFNTYHPDGGRVFNQFLSPIVEVRDMYTPVWVEVEEYPGQSITVDNLRSYYFQN